MSSPFHGCVGPQVTADSDAASQKYSKSVLLLTAKKMRERAAELETLAALIPDDITRQQEAAIRQALYRLAAGPDSEPEPAAERPLRQREAIQAFLAKHREEPE